MQTVDMILTNGWIVTQNEKRQLLRDGALAISDGKIADIGLTEDIMSTYVSSEVFDLKDDMVFPGLINTHTHLFQVATKGLGEDMPVQQWVEKVTAPTALNITPEEIYQFCMCGCLELIHSGVTTLVDMSYKARTFASHEQNIQAMLDSGMRCRYTTNITDYGLEYGIPAQLIKPVSWYLEQYASLQLQYPATDHMAVWLAIGAPWVVTEDGLKETVRFADRTATPLVMHINENREDNALFQRRIGKNVIPYLDEIGFLRPDLLAIHCVDVDQRDIELFKKHDVKISYNPVSNMYLGSGIAPIIDMMKAGLTISLGVDGAGSNNSQDMLESIKVGSLLQKVGNCDASVVSAQQALDWATRDGARALGIEDNTGSLEVGKSADLFVLSRNSAKIVPVHDPVSSLVYSSGEENVVHNMARGRFLMKDRKIEHINEEKILEACQKAALELAYRSCSNKGFST